MTEQTNAFFYNYQLSKLFWSANDDHWQRVLASPPNPISRKKPKKSYSRKCTKEEIEENIELMEKYFKS